MASSGSSRGSDNHFREKHECFQTSECVCGCEPNMEDVDYSDICIDSFAAYSFGLDQNELIEYYSRVCISDGFDVPDFNKSSFFTGIITPVMKPGKENINSHLLQRLKNASELAIQDFNRKNAVNYVLVKVVKANVYNYIFFVTFEGKKGSDLVETFEAKVYAKESEQKKMEVLMCRRKKVIYQGSKGQKIPLLTNHFKVHRTNVGGHFHHYSISLSYEDGRPVYDKDIGRRVIDRIHGTCDTKLAGKIFAYDGDKSLFTVGCLPHNKLEFTIGLEEITSDRNNGNCSPAGQGSPNQNDRKRLRRGSYQSKSFKVEISFVDMIPLQALEEALRGQVSENSQKSLRVLDIILRQHASKQGCLFVRQSFFHNDPKNFAAIGGGVLRCRGFHSSFRTSQGGLSLNIDVSTTLVIQPGPVVDFLIANQDVKDPFMIDWAKAKHTLKNLRVKTSPANSEYKITGLSDKPCREQTFPLKQKGVKDEDGEVQTIEVTVYDYFVNYRHIELHYSADLPCINVGKPKHPTYFPLELCSLVSLQRYTKALSTFQRASLVEKSRQNPQERMRALSDALKINNYDAVRMLLSCGTLISTNFAQVEGRVLPPPKLKAGNGEIFPQNGQWNFNKKKFVVPAKIERWAVVNFSARCDIRGLLRDLIRIGEMKGIFIDFPHDVLEENPQYRSASPLVRVEKMFECIQSKLPGTPQCVICLLPERKNSDLYGPWKRKCFAEHGIVTQCMAPTRINDLYLTNVLLKINAKLGGLNSLLAVEDSLSIPIVSKAPTIILGMNVSHGSPGHSDIPSIAAVVSSRHWPLISRYRASVRTQSAKVEMIDSLYKPVSDNKDDGIIRELLVDFYASSGKRKPDQFIIFRDGVSESQFDQLLNIELHQIIEACKFLDCDWSPKFVLIVAQKNHHTKFFQSGSPDNVPPGTVIDNNICHPQKKNFYLCAHDGMIGTTRPTHYHVLFDDVGFSADDLQELVHSLSYVSQRSTTAISVVAPLCYAHLAATQVRSFMKFEYTSDTSSVHGGYGFSARAVPDSMFFC